MKFEVRVLHWFPEDVHCDMSFLEGVGKLDRVEFVLEEPELEADYEELQNFATIYRIIQNELIRVAQSLVTSGEPRADGGAFVNNHSMIDWLHEAIFEDEIEDGSYWCVEHSWHLECRRGDGNPQTKSLRYRGLPCWLAVADLDDSPGDMHHYRQVANDDDDDTCISWHCEASDQTITMSYRV